MFHMTSLTILLFAFPLAAEVLSVDGTQYLTIRAAVADAPQGGTVYVSPGYSETITSTITVRNTMTIILDGSSLVVSGNIPAFELAASNISLIGRNSATITLSGVGAQVVAGRGALANILIDGLHVNGSGLVSDNHNGIQLSDTGGLLTNLQITNNTITNVVNGIIVYNQESAGQPQNVLISGNYIKNVVGTSGGRGYGINVSAFVAATGQMQSINAQIVNNYIEDAQRHSIYWGFGQAGQIRGNHIKNHARLVKPNGNLAAIMISRAKDILIEGNVLDTSYDVALQLAPTSDFPPDSQVMSNIIVVGNIFSNSQSADLVIGTPYPKTDGSPDHITVKNNTFYKTFISAPVIQHDSGKQVQITDNSITALTTRSAGIFVAAYGEGPGTKAYSDTIMITSNHITVTGGSDIGIWLSDLLRQSSVRIELLSDRIRATNWIYFSGAGPVNPNIHISDTP